MSRKVINTVAKHAITAALCWRYFRGHLWFAYCRFAIGVAALLVMSFVHIEFASDKLDTVTQVMVLASSAARAIRYGAMNLCRTNEGCSLWVKTRAPSKDVIVVLNPIRTVFTSAALCLLASCADLSEITKFADSSQKVGQTFADIAAGSEQSCLDGNKFITPANHVAPLDCPWFQKTTPSLIVVNKVLFDYIASLGKLSGDDTSKVGTGLDNLSADLKKADPNISTAEADKANAVGGLAKAITEVWASGYRQRKLAEIIKQHNQEVKDATGLLGDYAADIFRQFIEHASQYESSYCNLEQSDKEPLATILLNRACDADHAQYKQKLAAIKAYQTALNTIQTTHAKLAAETGKWDVQELTKDFGSSASDLAKAASTIRKAF
jgi:hypothetical protein